MTSRIRTLLPLLAGLASALVTFCLATDALACG